MSNKEGVVEIKANHCSPYVRHVLETIFIIVGFPFRFVNQWQKPIIKVVYDKDFEDQTDLFIPSYPYDPWTKIEPKITVLENLSVLYVVDKPQYFIQNSCVGFDLVNSVYYLISRQEEYPNKPHDSCNPFLAKESVMNRYPTTGRPIIDIYINLIRQYIEGLLIKKSIRTKPIPLWKNHSKFAVALTHDVDRLAPVGIGKGVKALFNKESLYLSWNKILTKARRQLSSGLKKNEISIKSFQRMLDIEEDFGVRSTFFVANIIRKHPSDPKYDLGDLIMFRNKRVQLSEVLKILIEEKWEIGLHGSCKSYDNEDLQKKEKYALQETLGHTIAGQRQHRLLFDQMKTWVAQEKAGFRYDSTLGYNDAVGFRAGISYPYYPYHMGDNRKLSILEAPLTLQDCGLFDMTVLTAQDSNKSLIKEEYYKTIFDIVDEMEEVGGLMTILWHTDFIMEDLNDQFLQFYIDILNYLSAKDAYIAPMQEIVKWWQERIDLVFLN